MAEKKATFDFENAMQSLEKIVTDMESGGLSLDQSLQQFEQGIKLVRSCQQNLQTIEQKVQRLVEKEGKMDLEPFTDE
jgi:exodeoxyribonuclease VII small subunit